MAVLELAADSSASAAAAASRPGSVPVRAMLTTAFATPPVTAMSCNNVFNQSDQAVLVNCGMSWRSSNTTKMQLRQACASVYSLACLGAMFLHHAAPSSASASALAVHSMMSKTAL